MEQETYLERIKRLKSSRKITNDKLSEMTGIPLGTLSKLLAGINDSPKLSNIVAISRALDCSVDWLITGVPENTHNYTLEPAEMTLVEAYRGLDGYGRTLVQAVVELESTRVLRQADEEALRLHDAARRSARRGAPRLRRPEDGAEPLLPGEPPVDIPSAGLLVTRAVTESLTDRDESPVVRGEPTAETEEHPAPAALTAADLIRGGGDVPHDTEEETIPRSRLTRGSSLPAGLRRRHIDLYDMPVSAGVGEFLTDANRIEEILIPDDLRTAEADFALRINGDSMEPRYHSGDILLVQSADTVEEGELGIFVLDGSGFFKKYGGDCLISLNPQYPPIPLRDFQSVACCGRVVGKLKKK